MKLAVKKTGILYYLLLITLLYGKLHYFIFGFGVGVQSAAPLVIVILKDIVFVIFLYFFYIYLFTRAAKLRKIMHFTSDYCYSRLYFIIRVFFVFYFCVSVLHFFNVSTARVIQIHFRNILMVFLIIPITLEFYALKKINLKTIFNIIKIWTIIGALITIGLFILPKSITGNRIYGVSSLISVVENPNSSGFVFNVGILIYIAELTYVKYKKVVFIKKFIILLVLVLALMLCISLSGVVVFVFNLFVIFIVEKKSRKLIRRLILLLGIGLIVIILYLQIDLSNIFYKVEKLFNILVLSEQIDYSRGSFSGRLKNLDTIVDFLRNADLGEILFGNFSGIKTFDSSYYFILYNSGILILIFFIYLNWTFINKSFRLFVWGDKKNKIYYFLIFSFILMFMVYSLFTAYFVRVPINAFIFLCYALCIILVKENRKYSLMNKI